jgi:hypothetical protein
MVKSAVRNLIIMHAKIEERIIIIFFRGGEERIISNTRQ